MNNNTDMIFLDAEDGLERSTSTTDMIWLTLIFVAMVLIVGMWAVYAVRNLHSNRQMVTAQEEMKLPPEKRRAQIVAMFDGNQMVRVAFSCFDYEHHHVSGKDNELTSGEICYFTGSNQKEP
jgi:hypothetical protein